MDVGVATDAGEGLMQGVTALFREFHSEGIMNGNEGGVLI
jgi:hypothetical protein